MFDELTVMKNYTGLVLLLEEDYYVAPDVITILQMMNHLKRRYINLSMLWKVQDKIMALDKYEKFITIFKDIPMCLFLVKQMLT